MGMNYKIKKERCERCGLLDIRILEVHHRDRNKMSNNVSNLQVLCRNCHRLEHYQEECIMKSGRRKYKTYIRETAEIMELLDMIVPEEHKDKMMRIIELLLKRKR